MNFNVQNFANLNKISFKQQKIQQSEQNIIPVVVLPERIVLRNIDAGLNLSKCPDTILEMLQRQNALIGKYSINTDHPLNK